MTDQVRKEKPPYVMLRTLLQHLWEFALYNWIAYTYFHKYVLMQVLKTGKNIHTICTIQNEAFVLVFIWNLLLFF